MTEHFGATKDEWSFFQEHAPGDLLPVVSNPNAQVAQRSKMKAIGKTPSRYDDRGAVQGIAKWTERTSHKNEVKSWATERDYGICVQTRHIRGLDIDVPDHEKSNKIAKFIREFLDDEENLIPERYRENSGKTLLALKIEGTFGKRVVQVDGGMIEFLANGQQFVAAGTHPSGARYQWSNNTKSFPTLSLKRFEDLWFALCEEFATEEYVERGVREYVDTGESHEDPTAKFLIEKAFVHDRGNDGQLFIDCPFKDGHSTEGDGTDTAYFPAGSGGYERGHFICLHASCMKRKEQEFLDAFGVREAEFDVVEFTEEEKAIMRPEFDRDKNGRPKATLYNIRRALERPDIAGWNIRYDIFTDNIIFYNQDFSKWEVASDELFVELRMKLESVHQFHTVGRELIRDSVSWFAKKNQIDTAIEWVNSLEWDGKPRIKKFLPDYLGCENNAYTRAVGLYLWTGLAGRVLEPGLKADMILVLKSPEGYRKSSAVEAIAPSHELFTEIDFGEKDADLARKMRGKVIAEIAELRGLKTRAVEGILSFVSRRFEEWVPKYREFSTSFPRRLMFIATTNEEEFLDGARKHRRWLPATVVRLTDTDAIKRDRAQLWAEAREMFLAKGLQYEQADALALEQREMFRVKGIWEDIVQEWLDTPDDMDDASTPANQDFIRTMDVARFALNLDPRNIKRLEEMKIADTLKALDYEQVRVWDKEAEKQIRAWRKKDEK